MYARWPWPQPPHPPAQVGGHGTAEHESRLALASEEVGTDHVSDHALRFSSDVSMEP